MMILNICRGDHIVPSFDEMFPGLRGDQDPDCTSRKKHIDEDYYQTAMEVTKQRWLILFFKINLKYINF